MALKDELSEAVSDIFKGVWAETEGRVVPSPDDVGLGNKAVQLPEASVLYADLSSSTKLVDSFPWSFVAEMYKSYLYCAARLIRSEGGTITAYDGDRIMGIFIGDSQSTSAARCGLKINWVVGQLINPAIKKHYPSTAYVMKQTVGIDRSVIRAARTGVRGDNDLVWIGRAANYAAKLTELSPSHPTRITKAMYDKLHSSLKYGGPNKDQPMWEKVTWSVMDDKEIYRSTWHWPL